MNPSNDFRENNSAKTTSAREDKNSFYKIYKALIRNPDCRCSLSDSAILLYSMFLDRNKLSLENNWIDKEGKVFIIYPISEIQGDLNCSKSKAIRLLEELENGFIYRKRIQQNYPAIIYVRSIDEVLSGFEKVMSRGLETLPPEVLEVDFRKDEKKTPRGFRTRPPEVQKRNPNKTDNNKTDRNKKVVVKSEEQLYQEVSFRLEKIRSSYDPFLDPLLSGEEKLLGEYMLEFKENRNSEKIREVFFDLSFIARDYMRIAEADRNTKRAEKALKILQEVYEHYFFDTITIRKLKELQNKEVSSLYLLIADYLSGEYDEKIRDIHSYCARILKNKIACL